MQKIAKNILKDFYDINEYDLIDNGVQQVNVDDIIGMSDSRIDEYNNDWSPKNPEDPRWLNLYNGYQNDDNIPPIPLIQTPDNYFFADGDGNHRISVVKTLNMNKVPAHVFLMVSKEKNID